MQKCEISKQVFDLSLSSIVRTVNDFDNVSFLDGILFGIQGHGVLVFTSFLQSRRTNTLNLAMHVEHLEGFPLDLNNDAHGLGVQLDHVTKLKLAKGVHAGGHVGAELQILW